VPVKGDTLDEPDQAFFLDLEDPQKATLADGRGQATITDDDGDLDLPETQLTGGPDGATNDPTPAFTYIASTDDATFECRVDADDFAPCRSGDSTRPLRDGDHTFEVRARNPDGGTDPTPELRAFTVDTVAPGTTIVRGPARLTNDPTPTFETRAGEAGSHIECRIIPARSSAEWQRCPEEYTSPQLADGEYTFEARARDRAGNADPTPATHVFTVDTTPPDTSLGSSVTTPAGEDELRNVAPSAAGAQGGGELPVSNNGRTTLQVSCPAYARYGCKGTMLLMRGDVVLARASYDVPPGQMIAIPIALPLEVINRIEREGSMEVFALASTRPAGLPKAAKVQAAGAGAADPDPAQGEGQRLMLKADPRSPRVRDAGLGVALRGNTVRIRLTCPAEHRGACRGRTLLARRGGGLLGKARFKIARGRTRTVRVRLSRSRVALVRRLGRVPAFVRLETSQPRGKPVRKRVEVTVTAGGRRR
jgi:hypothetical protein